MAQRKLVRIGILAPLATTDYGKLLLQRLAELGYAAGALQLEYRSADGHLDRYAKLAKELAGLKCDLLFAFGPEQSALALRASRPSAPIVFLSTDYDPVEKGLVGSLNRPGANITGVFMPQPLLAAKRMELAREALPGVKRFLVIEDPNSAEQVVAMRRTAAAKGIELTVVRFERQPFDYAAAFETGRKAGVDGFLGVSSPAFGRDRAQLSALIEKHRLPAVVTAFMTTQSGFLLSYSSSVAKASHRAAEIAARILKGARAADIPVEQVDEYDLVINMKNAKTLGTKLPFSVLARATRIIE